MQELNFREIAFQVLTQMRGVGRYKWHMALIAWSVCVISWTVVYFMEDEYISRARVLIEDPQGELKPYLNMTTPLDVTQEARRLLSTLQQRQTLFQVVKETDLALMVKQRAEIEDVLADLRTRVSLTSSRGNPNLYTISFTYHQPRITQQVVQTLLNMLTKGEMGGTPSGGGDRTAQKFLGEQIQGYETRVAEAEALLQDFKRRNAGILPTGEGTGGYYGRLNSITKQLEDGTLRVRELEERRNVILRQLKEARPPAAAERPASKPVIPEPSANSGLDRQISELQVQIQTMLDKSYMRGGRKMALYTEEHPDIMALRRRIQHLEEQKQVFRQQMAVPIVEEAQSTEKDRDRERDADPIYRQVKMSLTQVDADLASAKARVDEYQSMLNNLRTQEEALPAVEAELIRLERNVKINRDKLVSLLGTQGEARFSGDVAEGLSRRVRFRILETPSLPTSPISPNRPLFLSVAMIGGILAGFALALFTSIMRPVFDSPASLKKALGLPVLGTISMVEDNSRESMLEGKVGFTLTMITLFGLYIVLMLLNL
ncbi:MAG: hypothetical protein HQL64_12505 [Magnetococcales bacterium]|nr:hypothetical protein [Magnetococcales bacterium]